MKKLYPYILILVLWITSYATAYITNKGHIEEMERFMHQGKRFTFDDGEALKRRVEVLENQELIAPYPEVLL
jgi:hypothetical protein